MILTDHVIFVPNPIWRFFLRVTISKYVHLHSICVLVASIWKEEDCLHRFWISWLQVSILCRDGESKRRLSRWSVSELSLDSLAIVARLTYNRLTSDWQHSVIRRQPVDLDITVDLYITGRLGYYRSTWTLPVDLDIIGRLGHYRSTPRTSTVMLHFLDVLAKYMLMTVASGLRFLVAMIFGSWF